MRYRTSKGYALGWNNDRDEYVILNSDDSVHDSGFSINFEYDADLYPGKDITVLCYYQDENYEEREEECSITIYDLDKINFNLVKLNPWVRDTFKACKFIQDVPVNYKGEGHDETTTNRSYNRVRIYCRT